MVKLSCQQKKNIIVNQLGFIRLQKKQQKIYLSPFVELMGANFVVSNPNAKSTCGCGSSFSV